MNAARKNGGEGGGPRRFYKLVGGLVVILAIAAALVPLWLGGGSGKQPQVVEVQPDVLRDGGTERSRSAEPQAGAANGDGGDAPASGDQAADSGKKWWQSEDEPANEPAEDSGTSPGTSPGTRQEPADPATGDGGRAPAEAQEAQEAPRQSEPEAPSAPPARAGGQDGGGEPADAGQQVAKAEGPYWTVMVGSFRNPDNAAGLRDRLREQGFAARVVTKTVDDQQWNRVYAGREGSRQDAEALMPRLKEAGYEDMLVLKAE